MRLFPFLSKKIMPNGHMYIGKHRLEYKPPPLVKDRVRYGLEVEERNLLLLRHPFLSIDQSRRHQSHVDRWAIELDLIKKKRKDKWWKPVRLEDKLNHLRHTEGWDV